MLIKIKHSCRTLVVPKLKPRVSMVEPVSLDLQTKDIAVCVPLESQVNTVKNLERKYNECFLLLTD